MAGPPKGTKPNLAGVLGEMLDSIPDDVVFGERKIKASPYDPLLLKLKAAADAGSPRSIRFPDLRCRASITGRAKKLKLTVLFGEKDGFLYVSLADTSPVFPVVATDKQTNGSISGTRSSICDIVLEGIRDDKRDTPGLIVSYARVHGIPDATLKSVDHTLATLLRQQKIKLKPVRHKMDTEERWTVA